MEKLISIRLEVCDDETLEDIIQLLEIQLGYIADNFIVLCSDAV